MNDKDLENLYKLNLDLFDSWSELYDVEKDPEAKEAMKKHVDSMDLILGWVEKTLEYKDETVRTLRWNILNQYQTAKTENHKIKK